jgi:hypothetical protein
VNSALKPTLATGALVLAALVATACSDGPPPRDELAAARATIDSAMVSGAVDDAPLELRNAQDKLDRAYAAVAAKDYQIARRYAREAQADARLAMAKEQSVKSQRAAQQIDQSVRALDEEMSRQTR